MPQASSALIYAFAVMLAATGCKHRVGPDYFGKRVQPPHGLDKLRLGMTMADARAAVPEIDKNGNVPSGCEDLELEVSDLGGGGRVESIHAKYELGFAKLLTDAWGPPLHDQGLMADAEWEDATTGWRAELSSSDLHFFRLVTPEYFGKPAHPFGALAKLASTSTADQAQALVPTDVDYTAGNFTVVIDRKGHQLQSLAVMALPPSAKAALLKAWGPGIAVDPTKADGNQAAWFDPDAGWRAFVTNETLATVRMSPYLPTAKFLGDGSELAVLPQRVLGRSIDEVRHAYPDVELDTYGDHTNLKLSLAPTEWDVLTSAILMRVTDGKVALVTIPLDYSMHPAHQAELLALFAKKWGEPTADASRNEIVRGADRKALVYPSTPTFTPVVEDAQGGQLLLELRPLTTTSPATTPKANQPAPKGNKPAK